MRSIAPLAATLFLSSPILAQTAAPRFVEVLVTDSVRLPFAGMDIEVRMANPFQQVNESMSESDGKNVDYGKLIDEAVQKAKAEEQHFLDLLNTNKITYRLSETEHAQDFAFGTRKTSDVNSYLVRLNGAAEMENYYKLTEGSTEFAGTPKATHYGDPSAEAPRLMGKLYAHAKQEAEALAAVTGGQMGRLISAQEIPQSEGSMMEMLMAFDKGSKEEMMMAQGSTHTSTMTFRFELLDRP
ncbi:MAG: hypothetical protein ABI432_05960 [Flavobacteriales bacterium]